MFVLLPCHGKQGSEFLPLKPHEGSFIKIRIYTYFYYGDFCLVFLKVEFLLKYLTAAAQKGY